MSAVRRLAAVSATGDPAPRRAGRVRHLRRADAAWAAAFAAPYAVVFAAFVAYPVAAALWVAANPSLYADLLADPLYWPTLVNTLLFVGFGVNLQLFLALLLSGFFLRREWWMRALLVVYVLPWFIATAQACVSIHWILIGREGLVGGLLAALFGIDGPKWFGNRWLALACDVAAYIWKWMPFWTLIFLAGRLTIPRDIYDSAKVDGAIGVRRFTEVTFPLLANLYLLCTLLATLWAVGEFTTPFLVSSGAPGLTTEVLATLGYHYAFEAAQPDLAVAAVVSVLPLLIPLALLMIWRLQSRQLQL